MALSNNKITAPVSVDDVKSVLGESSNDLAALCKSSKINVWAKYKPTVYPSPFPDDWYKAKDGNYGINITVENGKSIFQHDPKGKVAEAYQSLAKEVLADADRQRKLSSERAR